jgi:hypothetical protein
VIADGVRKAHHIQPADGHALAIVLVLSAERSTRACIGLFGSCSGRLDHLRAFDAAEAGIEALELEAEGVMIDAELMQHRGVEIVDGGDVFLAA